MKVPAMISDDALDALLHLCFHAVGGMDEDEFAAFVGAILRIIAWEVQRVKQEQRTRLYESEN